MSIEERLAKALAMHRLTGLTRCSGCDWVADLEQAIEVGVGALHGAHQASMIAALDAVAIVELPEPETVEYGHPGWGVGEDGPAVKAVPGTGRIRCYLDDARIDSGYAAELGAQLLAAARAAEATS